ncbi:MAG: YebC/PmpR family DNA-binding transcriptional regulator [Pirellulaceae bacterium]
MAGHSHAANVMYRKAAVDSKRSKLWGRISKAIMVAAKLGGGDPDANVRLRTAITDAKAVSMPKDNIERAIKKGTGELAGGDVEEVLYEGYGPHGVAILCDIVTDNRNRTAPEIRKLFEVNGGKLGGANCVAWMFERKGLVVVARKTVSEDKLMEVALEAGAEDVRQDGDSFEVVCSPDAYSSLTEALEAAGIQAESKQITRLPTSTVDLGVDAARAVLKLLQALDDHDDVQNVSSNGNLPDEALAELAKG